MNPSPASSQDDGASESGHTCRSAVSPHKNAGGIQLFGIPIPQNRKGDHIAYHYMLRVHHVFSLGILLAFY